MCSLQSAMPSTREFNAGRSGVSLQSGLCDEHEKGSNDKGDNDVEPKRDSFFAETVDEAEKQKDKAKNGGEEDWGTDDVDGLIHCQRNWSRIFVTMMTTSTPTIRNRPLNFFGISSLSIMSFAR
jgi:hypothetical protein